MRRWMCGLMCLILGTSAYATEPPDFIPDMAPDAEPPAQVEGAGKLFVELAVNAMHRKSGGTRASGNTAFDIADARRIGKGWRSVISGRLDLDVASGMGLSSDNLGLTLREAHLSADGQGWGLDLGRINVRDGVALGYNPTDVFRGGSLLVRRTEDPARLRDSRLGVIGLRLGAHTAAGQVSAMFAPGLGQAQAPSWYDPRWGAANGNEQYYMKYTPPTWDGLYTNIVWHQARGGARTVGLNATDNIGQATVVFAELARTRDAALLDVALGGPAEPRWRNRLAAGMTLATDSRQTVTLEYDYNGAGLARSEWNGPWQAADTDQLVRGFTEAGRRQDPLSRHSVMLMVQWERLLGRDDDLSCLVRGSVGDRSRFGWCEWNFRKARSEWAVSFSRFSGAGRAEYGANVQKWVVGAKARFYF